VLLGLHVGLRDRAEIHSLHQVSKLRRLRGFVLRRSFVGRQLLSGDEHLLLLDLLLLRLGELDGLVHVVLAVGEGRLQIVLGMYYLLLVERSSTVANEGWLTDWLLLFVLLLLVGLELLHQRYELLLRLLRGLTSWLLG